MGAVLHVHGPGRPPTSPPGWTPVPEPALGEALQRDEVDVVVLTVTTRRPIEALQWVHALAPVAQAVIEAPVVADERLERALRIAPGLPQGLRVLDPSEDATAVVRAAQEQAARDRRYAAVRASVMAQLAAGPRPEPRSTATPVGSLLGHAAVGAVVTDGAGLLVAWNDEAAAMLELGPEAKGLPLADRFAEPGPVAAAVMTAATSLERVAGVAAERPGAGVAFEVSFAPTRSDDDRPAVLGLVLDVTARRQAEHARDELAAQLASAARAQAFLLSAWDATAHTTSYAATLEALAAVAVPTLGDVCLIDVVDDAGQPRRMAARHARASMQPLVDELCRCYPPAAEGDHPTVHALATAGPGGRPRRPTTSCLPRRGTRATCRSSASWGSVATSPSRCERLGGRSERCRS